MLYDDDCLVKLLSGVLFVVEFPSRDADKESVTCHCCGLYSSTEAG